MARTHQGLFLLAVLAITSACGGGPASSDSGLVGSVASSASAEPATQSAEPSPLEPPASQEEVIDAEADFEGRAVVKDRDGYTYAYSYSLSLGPVDSNIANAKPGFAQVTLEPVHSATITNETPERNAPGAHGVWFQGLYKKSDPICQAMTAVAGVSNGLTVKGIGEMCALQFGVDSDIRESPATLGIGESIVLTSNDPPITHPMTLDDVPEEQVVEVMDELVHPVAFLLATGGDLTTEDLKDLCAVSVNNDNPKGLAASKSLTLLQRSTTVGEVAYCTLAGN